MAPVVARGLRLETKSGKSPLVYPSSDDVQRFTLSSRHFADVPFEPNDTYFAETKTTKRTGETGRTLKKPRVIITPGAEPGTIAFLDWHRTGPDALYIDYMRVRRDLRGEGFGRQLVADFYETVVGPSRARYVDWGRVMSEAAWKVYEEARRRYPDVHHHGKVYF